MDVQFLDGTVVRALELSERKEKDRERDYGLYLDAAWRPTWKADVVAWEDRGLPTRYETAAEQIWCAFRRAKRGERVEIGCKAGLGRTGTVLACMAILAGVPAGEAVGARELSPGRRRDGRSRVVDPVVRRPHSWTRDASPSRIPLIAYGNPR